ncbi:MAG: hypothetical protein COV72_09320 [Candidatus Omnitrophica bacterium CG11_big_fil_rev_8_21_14_0_20_42_13]|uniref:Lipid A biosynthesis acyltransferase n=1 Tax=Candidatus Ghiorseimicrobium undicola TaxID=1974746 RepID=A0A2H0LX39_9BACT|nr:MAG: hypothetical protein COV72_09320 [Candidatus Omnitrophica bacterium CG11_big_fil_rev_8_21_14_0_20_42_13]
MELKRIKKTIKRDIAFYSMKMFCVILRFMPKNCICAVGDFIAGIGYFIAIRHRRIARESLNIAFGKEKNEKEITRIIKDCFKNMTKSMFEMLASLDSAPVLGRMVNIEGKEYLDEALKKKKGVIMISGHFGSFPLLLTKLALLRYPVNVVVRKLRDDKADEYFDRKRIALGVKSIYTNPKALCVKSSIDALRDNEIVFMLMDQNFGSGAGVFVDFFGRKAATATGPIIFALRTEAPIVPAFIFREKNNNHRLVIEPELILEHREDRDEMVKVNVARITAIIERYIRLYPAEWGWIHRRWKSRPGKNSDVSGGLSNTD